MSEGKYLKVGDDCLIFLNQVIQIKKIKGGRKLSLFMSSGKEIRFAPPEGKAGVDSIFSMIENGETGIIKKID